MKHKFILFILSIFLVFWTSACQNSSPVDGSMAALDKMDLASLKSLLAKKKASMSQLKMEIDSIANRMEVLDPTMNNKKTQRVTILPVKDTVFRQFITVQGLLEADEIVSVNAETGGRLIKLTIDEGDYVKKGDLVGVLDMEQLTKQQAEIEKSYELAQEVYERQKRLWDQNIGSEIQYLQAKNEKERLEKSLETLTYQQSQGKIYAPVSGVVDVVGIREGELVSPGASIAIILDVRQLIATADVPENYLGSAHLGDDVTVRFPSLDVETQGRISLIGSKIDKSNRTFKIEVKVGRVAKNLKPNMLTEITLNISTVKDVITIPINIVQQEINGNKYLMVVDRNNGTLVARKVYITTGETNDREAIVTQGLSPGDEVILIGGRTVTEGSPLEILDNSVLSLDSNLGGQ